MKIHLTIFTLFIGTTLLAQSLKQKVADKHYALLAYQKAAPMYAELARKNDASTEVVRRAATCYQYINKAAEAEKWYAVLVTKQETVAMDYYHYIQALLMNGKYPEAIKAMEKFNDLKLKNSVGNGYAKIDLNYIKELTKDSTKYTIKTLGEINSTESDFAPSFKDKTELVFASNKENHGANNRETALDNTCFLDIYTVKLDTAAQETTEPKRFDKAFKSSFHDGPVSYSPDGNTMLVTRSNYYNNKLEKSSTNIVNVQLYYSTKKADSWEPLKPFTYNNKEYNFGQACFAPDGKTIYFVSDMPGTLGFTDIWKTTLDNGNFTQPENLGKEVNTEGREMFPFADGNSLLLFASDGYLGLGGLDMHYTLIEKDGLKYGGNMGYPVNTHFDDFGLIYDHKLLKGYFSTNRDGGKGKDDIYAVKLREQIVETKYLKGTIVDELTKQPLPFATLKITDKDGKVIQELTADKDGKFISEALPRKTDIKTITNQDYYKSKSDVIAYNDIPKEESTIGLNRQLFNIEGLVFDATTNKPVDNVKITYTQKEKNITKSHQTNTNGSFADTVLNKRLNDTLTFTIKYEKEGYLKVEKDYSFVLKDDATIKLSETMQKPEIGKDIAKAIQLNTIYFDVSKWNIRPDAAIELDKVAQVMKDNPTMKIELGAHTDCRNSKKSNQALSQKRAQASANYIVSKGVNKSRITYIGYGESKLINACECEAKMVSSCSEEEHQANRRTEFLITKF